MKRFLIEYKGRIFGNARHYETDNLENIDWRSVVSVTERSRMTVEQIIERFPELKIPHQSKER